MTKKCLAEELKSWLGGSIDVKWINGRQIVRYQLRSKKSIRKLQKAIKKLNSKLPPGVNLSFI